MKKLRRTVFAAPMAILLIGCAAKTEPTESKGLTPTQEVPVLQETEPSQKTEIAVTAETSPVRETENVQPASDTAATEPAEETEDKATIQSETPVTKPLATELREATPIETVPTPTEPKVTEPPVTEVTELPTIEAPETAPTHPPATNPPETVPPTTEPTPSEPAPTEPVLEETVPTEPPAEVIDTAALESYGRSYASSAYGYNGTSACTPGTGAGYFPAATKEITSMEDGRSYVRQAIDSQYKRDKAYGYLPYEEVDGKTVRCPINVSVSSAGGNTYTITVYYGGTA